MASISWNCRSAYQKEICKACQPYQNTSELKNRIILEGESTAKREVGVWKEWKGKIA